MFHLLRGVVEVLLRSGADPSVPNKAGMLPVELCQRPEISELFLRDRGGVFSPMVQSRLVLADYVQLMNTERKQRLSASMVMMPMPPFARIDDASVSTNYRAQVEAQGAGSNSASILAAGDGSCRGSEGSGEHCADILAGPSIPDALGQNTGQEQEQDLLGKNVEYNIHGDLQAAAASIVGTRSSSSVSRVRNAPQQYHLQPSLQLPVEADSDVERPRTPEKIESGHPTEYRIDYYSGATSSDRSRLDQTFSGSGVDAMEGKVAAEAVAEAVAGVGDYTFVGVSSGMKKPRRRWSLPGTGSAIDGEANQRDQMPQGGGGRRRRAGGGGVDPDALSSAMFAASHAVGPPPTDPDSTSLLYGQQYGPSHSTPESAMCRFASEMDSGSGVGGGRTTGPSSRSGSISAVGRAMSPVAAARLGNSASRSGSVNFYQPPAGPVPASSLGAVLAPTLILTPSVVAAANANSGRSNVSMGPGERGVGAGAAALSYEEALGQGMGAAAAAFAVTSDAHRRSQLPQHQQLHNQSNPQFLSPDLHSGMQPDIYQCDGGRYEEKDDEEESVLRHAVYAAAVETAAAMQSSSAEFQATYEFVRASAQGNEGLLRRLLAYDPQLPLCRTVKLGKDTAADGQTPLHVAAANGRLHALQLMLELGAAEISVWVRDLQGRTPLHVAAEKAGCACAVPSHRSSGSCPPDCKAAMSKAGLVETVAFLRQRMAAEQASGTAAGTPLSRRDPIGSAAPLDLAGSTPLGWATYSAGGKPRTPGLVEELFRPGDRSILPLTPASARAGKSPWKVPASSGGASYSSSSGGGGSSSEGRGSCGSSGAVVFAFSEARAWTPHMEDRVLVSCPVSGRPAWSLFGVCDGHGGAFSANTLAAHLPALLAREAAVLARYIGSAFRAGGLAADADTSPDVLQQLLLKTCASAELLLREHPRMQVEQSGFGAGLKLSCPLDSSGSTAILSLVTSR